jgi:oligoendopeptidase F
LFPDNVGEEVYDNLIATVGENLDAMHRYYGLRKRVLGLSDLRAYDLRVPLVGSVNRKTTWNEAACIISDALYPLGDEYVATLRTGLLGRWADRYPSQGKFPGAGCIFAYGHNPLIVMSYNEERIEDIGCLAHESGNAMHIRYSMEANPFRHFFFSIFEAETASAFHEELLFRHLLNIAGDNRELRLFIIDSRINILINMLYGHTRSAEFELALYRYEEAGTPLSADILQSEYNKLLANYKARSNIKSSDNGNKN